MRAVRLGGAQANDNLLILTATDLDAILAQANALKPQLLIIDSIQTMYNPELQTAAGSVGQVRECTAKLLQFAKSTGIAVLLIGHVTKDGTIAGPRLLEHMVDVVLQFEGDRSYSFRVLRALKNRFGSTSESGIFSMEAGGLQEVANPAGLFLEDRDGEAAGSVIGACMEGNRPIMAEFQALVAKTPYGMPRRTAVGFDLAVAAALVSSYRNRPLPKGILVFGEVGLTGEVRRVSAPERRIMDGINLGFSKFIVPDSKLQLPSVKAQIVRVKTLEQAIAAMFG